MVRTILLILAFLTFVHQAGAHVTTGPAHVNDVERSDGYSTPDTAIVAPIHVRRGHLVTLGVKPFAKPPGLVKYTYVWVVNPHVDDLFPWPDGSRLAFGSGTASDPSHYDVTLVANYIFVDKDGKNPVLKTIEVNATVDVGEPPVPPAPGPAPPPPPDVPDGRYRIASYVLEIARRHPIADASALASAYRSLAASGVATKAEMVNQTVPVIRAALGPSFDGWKGDLAALAAKVNTLNIVAVQDCKTLYTEIAIGLEARQ